MTKTFLSIVLAFFSLSLFAQTKVGDATLTNQLNIESSTLILNGSGLREKLWFDLYACGLYLENKNSNATKIVNGDQPMAMYMEILSSLLSKKKLVGAFKDGLKKTNSNETIKKTTADLNTFLGFLNDEINVGDKYSLVYIPNQGTSLYINNAKKGTIKGLLFKSAIFNIWLANDPVDDDLKEELLNK